MNTKPIRTFPLCLVLVLTIGSNLAAAQSFWSKLLRITGISATPSMQKGELEEMIDGGQIWIVEIQSRQSRKLTEDSGYHTPVFTPDGGAVLAIKSNAVWRVPLSQGTAENLQAIPGLSKLVGFSQDDTNQLCILVVRDGKTSVKLLSLTTGHTTEIEYDKNKRDDRIMLEQLKRWEREYGQIKVYPEKQRKKSLSGDIEWDDIVVKRGSADPVNVSNTNGVNCGQPSLSPSGQDVVFIKELR